jgi:hypothetical protein
MNRNEIAYEKGDSLVPEWIGELDDARIARVMEAFTAWPSDLDDEIPAQPISAVTNEAESAQNALGLQSRVAGNRLILSTPPGARVPEGVRDIEIRLPNAHVVVSLEQSTA